MLEHIFWCLFFVLLYCSSTGPYLGFFFVDWVGSTASAWHLDHIFFLYIIRECDST